MKKLILAAAALAVAWIGFAGAAEAQWAPTRKVRLAVPFPAGGGTDLLARVIAKALSDKWQQPVYVENLSGAASGNVGALEIARSEPDGYSLLLSPPGPIAMNQLLYKHMPFDSSKWVAISVVASVPYVLDVRNGLGVSTVKDLIRKAKDDPGKITYASPGVGTVGHLAAKELEMQAGISLTTVPYSGLAPALMDVAGGHVDMIFDTLTTSLPLQQGKQLNIIAVASPQRAQSLPDVPTVAESGLPGFRAVTWYGIVAPPGTPADVATKISNDIVAVTHSPEVVDAIRNKLKMDPMGISNAAAAAMFVDDAKLWSDVIKKANISLD